VTNFDLQLKTVFERYTRVLVTTVPTTVITRDNPAIGSQRADNTAHIQDHWMYKIVQ